MRRGVAGDSLLAKYAFRLGSVFCLARGQMTAGRQVAFLDRNKQPQEAAVLALVPMLHVKTEKKR